MIMPCSLKPHGMAQAVDDPVARGAPPFEAATPVLSQMTTALLDRLTHRSHMAHRLQTTLTPAQEAVAVALRKTLPVSLDDLLAVMREFLNPDVSRSGLDSVSAAAWRG